MMFNFFKSKSSKIEKIDKLYTLEFSKEWLKVNEKLYEGHIGGSYYTLSIVNVIKNENIFISIDSLVNETKKLFDKFTEELKFSKPEKLMIEENFILQSFEIEKSESNYYLFSDFKVGNITLRMMLILKEKRAFSPSSKQLLIDIFKSKKNLI